MRLRYQSALLLSSLLLAACSGQTATTTTPTAVDMDTRAAPTAAPAITSVAAPTAEAEPSAGVEATAAPTTEAEPTTEAAPTALPPLGEVEIVEIASGFTRPTHITNAGDGSGRLFVVEQAGLISIIRDGQRVETPFLDIRDLVGSNGNEQGLLSVAFHPQYAENGRFFVNYTDRNGDTVVARYSVSDNADVADPASALLVINIAQPQANHNGGQLAFGPDGYLYIGMGDGGGGGDPQGNGQNLDALLGKMLRLDIDSAEPYAIPGDNPFVDQDGARPEIWAWGLRNPWRFSFDSETGDLFIADVGQNQYEEINFQPAASAGGENYGWNIMEASSCYNARSCERDGLVLPVAEYAHNSDPGGCSVTGGFVYRGSQFPALTGAYLYGDYCTGNLWSLRAQDGVWVSPLIGQFPIQISSFGEDEAGEIYLSNGTSGDIYQLVVTP